MAITPPYVKLSNGDVITFERLGPKITAVLSNSEGVLIRKGKPSFSATEKVLAEEIILEEYPLGFSSQTPTIVEEVLSPPPTTPLPPSPLPVTPSPKKVEEERLQIASDNELQLAQSNTTTVNATEIENATPSDLKAMGIAKLPLLLLVIGNQVKNIIEPALKNLIATYIQKFLDANACPDQATIDKIIQQRNLIVTQLNKIVKTLTIITISLTAVITFFDLLKLTIKGIDLAKIAAYVAAGIFPALLPALPNLIQKLDLAKLKLQTDEEGNAQIAKYKAIIGGAAMVSSIIGGFILISIGLLNSIDIFLQKCAPNQINELEPISKETQDITNVQAQAQQTQNETTYKGFIIEIELVPYTSTTTRRRAIGKNQDGIILIQTELSFTTDDQTLIDELKLIIDRDNLKAY